MRKPEQRLWDRMRPALVREFHLERIENCVGAGRPDVNVMYRGVTIPVEMKAAKYPKRPTTPILGDAGLNQHQLNWWLSWRAKGGRGFILVGVDKDLYLAPCKETEFINEFDRGDLAPYATDWAGVITTIKKEINDICLRHR